MKRFSYAGIIFHNGKRDEFAKSDDDISLVELRNVAGELKAAIYVMEYAKEKGAQKIAIYYDYAGIENWALGIWKTNTEFTRYYAKYAKWIMNDIKIAFIKVKAHSGDKYNDEVDKLAKSVLASFDKETVKQISQKNINDPNSSPLELDLSKLKGNKKSLDFGLLINEKILTSDDIYAKFKLIWKKEKRNLKDINEIKSYFDVELKQFILIVITEIDIKTIVIESGAFNG